MVMQARLALVAAGAILLTAQAPANPVMTHYRAYQAAIERNDMAAAETEAAAALSASVARDGNGGSTGALALNLANLRLDLGRVADAYAPAAQAHEIARASPNGALDPLMTSLVLGRAELTDARGTQGRRRLADAISQAQSNPDLEGDAYKAAIDWGRWSLQRQDYDEAVTAWTYAGGSANQLDPSIRVSARAEARLFEGISRFSRVSYEQNRQRVRATDTRLGDARMGGNAGAELSAAYQALAEAEALLQPHAYLRVQDDGLSVAQVSYAAASAWRLAVIAYAESTDQRPPSLDEAQEVSSVLRRRRPSCDMEVIADPMPQFPGSARGGGIIGATVVRLTLDERGEVLETRIAAAVPDVFRPAVERVAPQWRVQRNPAAPADCAVERYQFVSIRFLYR